MKAIALVKSSGRLVAEVARSLEIAEGTWWNWVKADRAAAERGADPEALSESERDPPHLGPLGDHHPLGAVRDPVRLHRDLLQPATTPTRPRRPHPRRGLRCQPGSLIYQSPVSIKTGQLHRDGGGAGTAHQAAMG